MALSIDYLLSHFKPKLEWAEAILDKFLAERIKASHPSGYVTINIKDTVLS